MTHSLDGITPSVDAPTAVRMRASDVDRLGCVQVLQDAIARGLLTPAEGSDRMGDAFAAVYRADLAPLTEDLPPVAPAVGSGRAPWQARPLSFGEQLRSWLLAGFGDSRAARLGAALLLFFLLVTLGMSAAHLMLDGGYRGGGPGPGGFGHR